MLAREIMSEDLVWCTPETKIETVGRQMCDGDYGCIPVVESKSSMKPIGMVTDRDIVCRTLAKGKNPLGMTVNECLSRNPVLIEIEAPLEECCAKMKINQVRRLIVVDAKGACCGVIALSDLARKATDRQLVEVVRGIVEDRQLGIAEPAANF